MVSCEHAFVTSQGTPGGRFGRALKQKNLWGAEMALREMRQPSLLLLLDYLGRLAELRPEKLPLAALRWHGRLELEASTLTLGDSQLAATRSSRSRPSPVSAPVIATHLVFSAGC